MWVLERGLTLGFQEPSSVEIPFDPQASGASHHAFCSWAWIDNLRIFIILLHQQTYDHQNECLKQVIFRIKRVSKIQQRLPGSSLLLHCAWLLVHDSSTPLAWRVYDQLIPYDAHISMPIFPVGIHVLSLPCKQSETYDGLFKRMV